MLFRSHSCMIAEAKCADCQDDLEVKQINSAYRIVDEGNLQYSRPVVAWMYDDVSGHDWVSPVTITSRGVRHEFTEPVVNLSDRTFDPDLEMHADEVVCQSCYLVHLSSTRCPNCEE